MEVAEWLWNGLVDLLDGWAGGSTTWSRAGSWEATRHTIRHSTWHASSTLVQLCDDGVAYLLQLLLLVLKLVSLSSLKV